jgi:hypothetical protein
MGKDAERKRWWPNSVAERTGYKIKAYEKDKENNTDTKE